MNDGVSFFLVQVDDGSEKTRADVVRGCIVVLILPGDGRRSGGGFIIRVCGGDGGSMGDDLFRRERTTGSTTH